MLLSLDKLTDFYTDLFKAYPWWLSLLYAAVHALAAAVCIGFNRKDHGTSPQKTGVNTLHTVFWVMVILTLPGFGILLYLLGSVLPYLLWRRHAGYRAEFPYYVQMRRLQYFSVILAGAAGLALNSRFGRFRWNLGAEAAFFCWAVTVLLEWRRAFAHAAVFLTVHPAGQSEPDFSAAKDIFGLPHRAEAKSADSVPMLFSQEARKVRAAADLAFSSSRWQGIQRSGPVDDISNFEIVMFQSDFDKRMPDVIDAQYIGLGITRYVVTAQESTDQGLQFTDRVLYRAVPRLRCFLIRAAVLVSIYLALFTDFCAELHMKAAGVIDSLLSALR